MKSIEQLNSLLGAIQVLIDMPVKKLSANKTLKKEILDVVSGRSLNNLLSSIHADYLAEKDGEKKSSSLSFESPEFLYAYARMKTRAHEIYGSVAKKVSYTSPIKKIDALAFNASPEEKNVFVACDAELRKTKEAKNFQEVFNSIFSDRALQVNTSNDPTVIGSFIDYSPYINNYKYYLSIPTLAPTIDRSIQIATREMPRIECDDSELQDKVQKILKRSRFVERLQRMLLFSHLSPRGSLIVPIEEADGTIRFNIFNDTQFTYTSAYQYTRLDYRDDGANGVSQIFALGNLLQNGVTAHFLCPGFEPIYAIGKNRLFMLKDAAEAVNIYLYTVKVLCIRAQILVQKWSGDGQNDSMLSKMRKLTADINSKLSLSTSVDLPESADLSILNNNLSEGFAKVSPIIKEYQAMLSGIMPDYFYGSDTAYSANSFNIHATHQNIRSELQEAQIEPIYRFVINKLLSSDVRFSKWAKLEDDFDIIFPSLYEPTDKEKTEIDSIRIDNIIKMAGYPDLTQIFKDENLLGKDYEIPELESEPEPVR